MAVGGRGIGEVPLELTTFDPGERRRTARIRSVLRATIRLADLPESLVMSTRAVDISDLGVRVLVKRRLPLGARVFVDMECELPLRVHLGYDAHSLVVDGPMHTHLVRVAGQVARLERLGSHLFDAGIEFSPEVTRFDELQVVQSYVDHLREQDGG
ncbi:MAG: PilZ domain-containing protein [Gaiellales bacterium]